jgi:hypothetical protein
LVVFLCETQIVSILSVALLYVRTVLTGYIIAQEQQRGPNERRQQAIFIISCCYFLSSNV